MYLTALILLATSFINQHFILDSVETFMAADANDHSGLFVMADSLGEEGESVNRRLEIANASQKLNMSTEQKFTMGRTFYYEGSEDKCWNSWVMMPGFYLLSKGVLVVAMLIALGYLFLGIAIISDIFMEAIEEITSITTTEEIWDEQSKQKYFIEVPQWNATVANLTLMALGSSAPEILLSVIGTVTDLDAIPSELGPSTIVGSAAYNLLMISAFSIMAVDETPKKIADVGVFAVTSIFSLWAYIWLYICLDVTSKGKVEVWEAWVTFICFFLLIIISYAADRLNHYLVEKSRTVEEQEKFEREHHKKAFKAVLRQIVADKGEEAVLDAVRG